MKTSRLTSVALLCLAISRSSAEDITTLDGKKYGDVSSVAINPGGLYFVAGSGDTLRGVTVPFTNLPDATREKYHCGPFDVGLAIARQNRPVNLTRDSAFSLDNLEAAKQKAKAENKPLGFIMEWDTFFTPAYPMGQGSASGLADFYDVFHDNLVLVFVRHESELNSVPAAVRRGFFGPEEGGYAPNMCVVSPDCSRFICEIPYGGKDSNGKIREDIFRQKIDVIKTFEKKGQEAGK
jgi:hypothetical protein